MMVQVKVLTLHVLKMQTGAEVIVGVVLLSAMDTVLASVVYRRNTGHCIQQGIHKGKICRIIQCACQTVNIMVINEVVEVDIPVDTAVCTGLTVDRVVYLEVVLIIMGGIKSLVALIVCNTIEHFRVSPAIIIAVDYLAHEPEVTLLALAETTQTLEEIEVDTVSSVEADTVNTK